mgnify:CR=1 FL=1
MNYWPFENHPPPKGEQAAGEPVDTYNTRRRHGEMGMDKLTPQQKIEQFIIKNQPHPLTWDVNETLILYKSEKASKICDN